MKTIAEVEEWFAKYVQREEDRDLQLSHAKRGYWGGYEYSNPSVSLEDVSTYLVTDAQGNVMRSLTIDNRNLDGMSEDELFEWIFSQGKEKEWFITCTRTQVEERTIFNPDVLAETIENHVTEAESRRDQYITEIRRKKAHYDRWREACAWAKENGVKYVSERYNKFDTIRRNVIKAGLVEKWNELYPEFAIKGGY